jgi:hypothetical protein
VVKRLQEESTRALEHPSLDRSRRVGLGRVRQRATGGTHRGRVRPFRSQTGGRGWLSRACTNDWVACSQSLR